MSVAIAQDALAKLNEGTPDAPARIGGYDVIGRLGRGGMGAVFEAIDRERGSRVALKTLLMAGGTASLKLKNEFRVVADLAHPNVAPVYELACEEGLWFFTMELVDGMSLARWARGKEDAPRDTTALPMSRTLDDQETIPSADTVEELELPALSAPFQAAAPKRDLDAIRQAMVELASGVAALHDAGLRHGDIKPDNVLVREDGSVVLVDFGLARPMEESMGKLGAGTPGYMAPEQLAAEYVGPESDWYSVGTTLYRVLTGALPFDGDSMLELFFKKTHHLPVAPHHLLDELPGDLGELCMALLRPDREQRAGKDEIMRVCGGERETEASSARYRRTIFVGRDRELCHLEQAYGTARAGRLTLVHNHGPSGIGKTALLDSFLRGVRDVDSALVLRGRCYERESVPYKGFDRIVDGLAEHLNGLASAQVDEVLPEWTTELARAFPVFSSVPEVADRLDRSDVAGDVKELRRRAWLALGQLLNALREQRPVVLAIDDLQWADPDSANLLGELLRGSTPLLVVVGYRPEEARDNAALAGYFELCERFETQGMVVDLELEPLRADEAAQLARQQLAAVGVVATPERVERLTQEAHGVPFFIEELAHFVSTKGDLDSGVSLESAILARVEALPPEQRALMETIAVANRPEPQSLVFAAADVDAGALMALLALRRASLVSWGGAGADDAVAPYHDRIREAVTSALSDDERLERHLALGRAMIARHRDDEPGPWVFDAVRHLGAASRKVEDGEERLAAARLHLEAGQRAHSAGAFPLGFRCFEGGIEFLPESAWTDHYDLALELHAGATECAYLSASWEALDRLIAVVKREGRTVMDQLPAWEAQIDACAGRHQYGDAVNAALEVLELLEVQLPAEPTEAEVGAAVKVTLERLQEIGPKGLLELDDVDDPRIAAATRIQIRMSPAAYFGRPMLLPIIACNLVTTSIDRGLSTATPYALALFGIVLNTLELYPVSHTWGQLALELLDRWPDRRLEAATRHVLLNLVCCWMVPLSSILEPLRQVFDIGCRTGDIEYASYAAHGYTHNALYAGRPLAPLIDEGLELGEQMRALGQVNALHVHVPFEKLLRGLTGRKERPWTLDDDDFDEAQLLRAFENEGSRSGIFVQRVVMGLARFYFGRFEEARECLRTAMNYVDAGPSVWHQPIMHQFAGLAAAALADEADDERREALRAEVEASLATLRRLAALSPVNFAHRVSLLEAECLRLDGARGAALQALERAIEQAHEGSWVNDIALANELAANCATSPEAKRRYLRAARAGYSAWGASAKAEHVSSRMAAL